MSHFDPPGRLLLTALVLRSARRSRPPPGPVQCPGDLNGDAVPDHYYLLVNGVRIPVPAGTPGAITNPAWRPNVRCMHISCGRRLPDDGGRRVDLHLRVHRPDRDPLLRGSPVRIPRGELAGADDRPRRGGRVLPHPHERQPRASPRPVRHPQRPLPRLPAGLVGLRRDARGVGRDPRREQPHLLLQDRHPRHVRVPLPRGGGRAHADGDAREPLRQAGAEQAGIAELPEQLPASREASTPTTTATAPPRSMSRSRCSSAPSTAGSTTRPRESRGSTSFSRTPSTRRSTDAATPTPSTRILSRSRRRRTTTTGRGPASLPDAGDPERLVEALRHFRPEGPPPFLEPRHDEVLDHHRPRAADAGGGARWPAQRQAPHAARLDVPTLIVGDPAAFRDWLTPVGTVRTACGWSSPRRTRPTRPASPTRRRWRRRCVRDGSTDRSGAVTPRLLATIHAQTPHKPVVEAQCRYRRTADRGRPDAAIRACRDCTSQGRRPMGSGVFGPGRGDGSGRSHDGVGGQRCRGQMFRSLNGANRYAVLYRIENAKRADTRARRIDQFVAMLARGETIHPQPHPRPK